MGPRGKVVALGTGAPHRRLAQADYRAKRATTVIEAQVCAAGQAERTAELGLSALTTHNSLWLPNDTIEVISVDVRPLDAMLSSDRRVDVVKIDVEGASYKVWRGMQRIIRVENPDIAVVLEFGPEHLRRAGVCVDDWFAELIASGLSAWGNR